MAQDQLNNDVHVNGTLSAKAFNAPASSITNAAIIQNAGIEATKVVHQQAPSVELFAPGVTITAVTRLLRISRAIGTLVSVEAIITTAATDASRTVTVDLQKSTGAGAFATVLSATIGFTNTSPIRTPVAGTFSATGLVDNDILQIVVTVAGGAGAQAQGLLVTLNVRDEPV